ncbi:MAG: prepilin-type N-terminal cleavage/methylation domain-containing protein [Lachnospiraceae bacterium]|nr:prepilin-type N-terminal cleavage/methylation domain-containing protein [Lachnospiraceae bacterium]
MKNDNKGFSLIELIVVIAIMAILVGVLAPQFIKYVESSRQSTDIQNAAAIRSAIEVGVADSTITGDVTVAISSNAITVSGTGTASALTAVGLSSSTPCKSSGWSDGTIGEYDIESYTWSATDKENGSEPKKNIAEAFK